MLHNTLIVLHTIAALVCLVSGCFVVYKPPQTREQARLFQLYLATLVLLVAFMLVAIIGDWAHLAPFSQAAFVVLGLLGLYMVARGFQARRTLREQTEGWKQQFI